MDTDSDGKKRDSSPEASGAVRPRVPRPPYRRIAVTGLVAAALTIVGGLLVRSHLVEKYGLGPESSRTRAAWMLERAEEFFLSAGSVSVPDYDGPDFALPGHGVVDAESENRLRIALRIAQEVSRLDPNRADAQLLQARIKGHLGATDDVLPAHLDQAIAFDPDLRDARTFRAHLWMRRYMDRWERLEAGLLLGDGMLKADAELTGLRDRVLADARVRTLFGGSWPRDQAEVRLEEFRRMHSGRQGDSPALPVVDWEALAREWPSLLAGGMRSRRLPESCPQRILCHAKKRVHHHGRGVAWETDWWYSRWPSYGPKPRLESLAEPRGDGDIWPVVDGRSAWRKLGAKWVRELAAKAPDEGVSLAREAEAYEALGSFVEARRRADRAVAAFPEAPGIRLLRARVQEDLYDLEQARADYDEAIRLGDGRAEFLRVRAVFLLQTGQPGEALEEARCAFEIQDSATSLALLGDALVANGRAEEALQVLVGDREPVGGARCRALRALGRLKEAQAEADLVHDSIELALCTLELGAPASAAPVLDVSPDGRRDVPNCARWIGWSHLVTRDPAAFSEARARVMLALGLYAEALEFAQDAIVDQPMRATAHALRALALLELGRLPQARAASLDTLKINPRCPLGWMAHGRVLGEEKQFEKAAEAYEKALSLGEHDLETKAWLEDVRARMRR